MAMGRERWTRIAVPTKVEAPRKTYRFDTVFVSPGGLFVTTGESLDVSTQLTVSFAIEDQPVVAHAELRRTLTSTTSQDRGIEGGGAGWEMRLVRMEGDGSQILAEHIKKVLLESGGPK
jgi:PilZ domain